MTSKQVAIALMNICTDMDYHDYEEAFQEEVKQIEQEIEHLKNKNNSMLYAALYHIAEMEG